MTSVAAVQQPSACAWMGAWQRATGTVQGRDHWLARRNSQDAVGACSSNAALVSIVCDGCGSAPHSETGAQLIASLLARAVAARLECRDAPLRRAVDAAIDETVDRLARLAAVSDAPGATWVAQHLLATLIAVVVTPREAIVFRIGDGIVGINGRFTTFVAENDAPPYLGYRIVQATGVQLAALEPVIEWHGPAEELESVAIATDGASSLPGTDDDPHATLRAWLADDALYAHPEALRRRLVRLARDEQLIDWDAKAVHRRPGILKDDTSVLLLRRRPSPEG